MPPRRPTSEHQDAVARRLALLSAELAGEWPPPPDEERDDPSTGPPRVPIPGRHAARRRRSLGDLVPGLIPETLRGRVVLGPAQLTVVAVLVAAGLAVTSWWVLRGSPEAVPPPVAPAPAALATSAPLTGTAPVAAEVGGSLVAPSGPTSGSATTVTVDVAGKVRRPGIVVLETGARVVDALEAAGGARTGVDLTTLNLARPLVDGEQVLVGVAAPAGVAAAAAMPTAGTAIGPLVDLNTATQAQLETLPEVGPVTAQAILAWRDQHGGFTAVDELLEVDGIGEATLGQLAPYVTV